MEELIRKYKELKSLYPDNISFQRRLEAYLSHRNDLLSELGEVYPRYRQDAFDIMIEGDVLEGGSISLYFLGKTIVNIQEIVTSIAQSIRDGPTARGKISPKTIEYSVVS